MLVQGVKKPVHHILIFRSVIECQEHYFFINTLFIRYDVVRFIYMILKLRSCFRLLLLNVI
ncbi:hypothetical protein D3C78_1259750 [compost metagenome]